MKRDKSQAAITLQAFFRGHSTRKKFVIIATKAPTKYGAFLTSNDPKIDDKELEKYKAKEGPVALVGTSCLRSVELICRLGVKSKITSDEKTHLTKSAFVPTPKLFIVDNSEKVQLFWKKFKKFSNKHNSRELFIQHLLSFFEGILSEVTEIELCGPYAPMLVPKLSCELIKKMIDDYGFDYLRSIIINTTFVLKSWEDESTFYKLRNLFDIPPRTDNVYVYCSDISFMPDVDGNKILQSAHILKPKVSIHSDLIDGQPECIYLCDDSTPERVKKIITARNRWPSMPPTDYEESDEEESDEEESHNVLPQCL